MARPKPDVDAEPGVDAIALAYASAAEPSAGLALGAGTRIAELAILGVLGAEPVDFPSAMCAGAGTPGAGAFRAG